MISDPSPFLLLQEILWPDRWKSTVACVLLNRTKRAQVDKVWPHLFERAPGPRELLEMNEEELREVLAPLGLSKVRSRRLRKMAGEWLEGREFSQLTGVGEYALASDQIFYEGHLPEKVNDHALSAYVEWKREGGLR